MNHTNTTIPWTELQNETFNKTENETDLGVSLIYILVVIHIMAYTKSS